MQSARVPAKQFRVKVIGKSRALFFARDKRRHSSADITCQSLRVNRVRLRRLQQHLSPTVYGMTESGIRDVKMRLADCGHVIVAAVSAGYTDLINFLLYAAQRLT